MKKFLALLITLTLVATCFVGVASAADPAVQINDKFNAADAVGNEGSANFKFGFFDPENKTYTDMTYNKSGSGDGFYFTYSFTSWKSYNYDGWADSSNQIVYIDNYAEGDTDGFAKGQMLILTKAYYPYIKFTVPADGLYNFNAVGHFCAWPGTVDDGVNVSLVLDSSKKAVASVNSKTNASDIEIDEDMFLFEGSTIYLMIDPSATDESDEFLLKSFEVTFLDTATVSDLDYDVVRDFDKEIFSNFFEFGTIDKTTKAFTSEMAYWKSVQDDPATAEDESFFALCDGTDAHVNGYAPQDTTTYPSHLSVSKIIDDEYNRTHNDGALAEYIGKVSWKSVEGKDKVVRFKAPYDGYYLVEYSPSRMWASANQSSRFYVMHDSVVYDDFIKRADNTAVNFAVPFYLDAGEYVYCCYDENDTTSYDNAWLELTVTLYEGTLTDYTCAHEGGTATCAAQAICTKCGEPYGAKSDVHSSTELEWTYDDDSHSATYKCCGGEAVADTEHVPNDGVCECGYGCEHENGQIEYTVNGDKHSSKYDCCGKVVDTDVDHDFSTGDCVCGARKPSPSTSDFAVSVSTALAVISIFGFAVFTKNRKHR